MSKDIIKPWYKTKNSSKYSYLQYLLVITSGQHLKTIGQVVPEIYSVRLCQKQLFDPLDVLCAKVEDNQTSGS